MDAAIEFAVQTLGDMIVQEVRLLGGVEDKIQPLLFDMRWMLAFLREADRVREDERVKTCVSEMKKIVDKVEDLIEFFALKIIESKRRRPRPLSGSLVRNVMDFLRRWACIVRESVYLHEAGELAGVIEKDVKKLKENLWAYGINQLMTQGGAMDANSSSSTRNRDLFRTYSHKADPIVVGLDEDVSDLVDCLVETAQSDQHHPLYQAVFVSGIGGLGKTTLAKKIYTHDKIRAHFECFAWAYISQQLDTRAVLQGILLKLVDIREDQAKRALIRSLAEDELKRELFEILQKRKCLLVIDDIWSGDDWRRLSAAFPSRETRSRIIITSRVRSVSSSVAADLTVHMHEPQLLPQEEGWQLFQSIITFRNRNSDIESNASMKELGKEMVKHCAGLPFAITVIAGLLAQRYTEIMWKDVRERLRSNSISDMPFHEENYGRVLKLFSFSYDYLPYELKPCFLLLSNFPEDYTFASSSLMSMWIAEGMVPENEGTSTIQDAAYSILDELVERNMIQVVRYSADGRIHSCRMHDLMREMCVEKAKAESFLFNIKDHTLEAHSLDSSRLPVRTTLNSKVRRLALNCKGGVASALHDNKRDPQHLLLLRSLWVYPAGGDDSVVINEENVEFIFNKLNLLRVLHFGRVMFPIKKVPKQVGNLVYLRYLSFNETWVQEFPPDLDKLVELEYLDLKTRSQDGVLVPNVIWKMTKLRFLVLPFRLHKDNDELRLAELVNLLELSFFDPILCRVRDLFELINLRRVHFINGRLLEFGELCDQDFKGFTFRHLRSLSVHQVHRQFVEDQKVDLSKVLPACPNIFESSIYNQTLGGLPQALPQNLTRMIFGYCELTNDPMPILEKLPHLNQLVLKERAYLGKEMFCSSRGFPKLRRLGLAKLDYLVEWRMEEGAMPNLEELEIIKCPRLRMLPEALRSISKLRLLKLKSARENLSNLYRQGGTHFHSVQHLPSVVITED